MLSLSPPLWSSVNIPRHWESHISNLSKISSNTWKNGQNKLWQKIRGLDGNLKYDIDEILDEQINFYANLFSTEGWDKHVIIPSNPGDLYCFIEKIIFLISLIVKSFSKSSLSSHATPDFLVKENLTV
jgi:hypothetical protein